MRLMNLKNDELLIDENTKEPLKLIYYPKEENKSSLKIKIKEGIKASIIEVFAGNDLNEEFNREFIIEDNAKLEYLKYQNIGENSNININYTLDLKNSAVLNMINFELGEGSNKNNFFTNLDEKESKLNIYGLVKLYKNSKSESIFRTTHNGQKCFSNIKYKHILDDSSKATFDALSKVNESALFSKVLQNSNTVLLSDDAVIFARPHLEICIDELEASHGATTGSLNKEQLLYLQARGIEEKKAKQILLKAFENEIYAKIEDSKIAEFLKNLEGDNNV
ncbi:SufB/SufD family protein [Halarcobacter anaerophilus]|uniref:SufB/SufD family protein n=1 Tax=Halarcobacter anaerophilus TaxID=877500 RepID=UPI000695BFE1|nr:SufD family Fe-S cluster assembly protein [Halarcobacter anaerophilus]